MALPLRDKRGRFTKKGASGSCGAPFYLTASAPPTKASACETPTPLLQFIVDTNQLMQSWQSKYEEAVKQHEQMLATHKQRYEQTVADAEARLAAMINAATPTPPPEQPKPDKPPQAPAAVWIQAPDGEKLLMLNQAAAVMFLAVFDRMQEVTQELQKMVPGNRR